MLVFLPGEREIKRCDAAQTHLGPEYVLHLLYGALPLINNAYSCLNHGRKIVLATSIAETSLTIEDIRVVVDSGKARRAEFDPARGWRGLSQRGSTNRNHPKVGRAGRIAAGKC